MDAISLLQRLHQHRIWANHKLLDAAAGLSGEQLHSQFAIGQGSVWKSLLHLCGAEYVWLETIKGNEQSLFPGDLPGMIPGNQQGEGRIADLAGMRQRWSAVDDGWTAYLASLTPRVLEEVVYRTRTKDGVTMRLSIRRGDGLLHVCTHAHYTAAQVINMLRQNGLTKLPEIMLMALAREEAA